MLAAFVGVMNWLLVVIGFFVHLVFFYSIFDIYFTSPLVHGMTPQYSTLVSPAKRLVLFVADGLRADKLYEVNKDGNSRAPFLRSKMLHGGAWGVSHTRVPTESRPGHVAIIAGFYEDVSAVMRGWKENPVEFDSLFNESFHTWSWGSPDILPMFAKGASGDHVSMEMYPGHSEDFAGANLAQLDTWVFDRVKDFLKSAKSDQKNVNHPLFQDRVVLFLHLLGLDTNGHVHKPYSETYLENIKTVDDGIQQLVDQMEETFQFDGKTAYIFTADHGMTNWGSHGAGDPSETLTPLIAWGAGIRSAQQSSSSQPSHSPPEWNVNHVRRTDVDQADLCPLMATLVGVPIPLQSVGTTPVDFLAGDDEFKAESLFVNARQILQQFEIKRDHKVKTTLSVLYRPFQPLTPAIQADEVRHIQQSIRERNFDDAIKRSYNLIQLALDGLTYYHHYDKVLLGASIAFGFIGWMTYIVTLVLQNHTQLVAASAAQSRDHNRRELMKYAFICVGLLVAAFLFVQSQKWTYYLYLELPVVLWYQALKRSFILKQSFEYLIKHKLLWRAVLFTALAVIGLELMVLTFFYRELLTIGLIGMAIWSVFSNVKSSNRGIVVCWVLACVALSVFPLLPVVGRASNYSLVYAAGIVALLPTAYVLYSLISTVDSPTTWRTVYMIIVQDMLLVTSLFVVWNTAGSLGKNSGLPVINQCASWAILASAFILPLFSSNRLLVRLAAIYLAFLPSYLLLSTSYEGLFNIVLCLLMFCWLNVESIQLSSCGSSSIGILEFNEKPILTQPSRKLVSGDLRCAYFFIFFLLSAFFGTGNIASINSFDPSSILCFVTVFNPFVMGALMLWKILIPFLLVTCTFNAVHRAANVPTQSLFLVVLLISDFMALHFFFLVRDYGSWLEIGMSISHYVIVMAMICFLFLLLTLSKFFTNWSFSRLLAVVLQRKSHEL